MAARGMDRMLKELKEEKDSTSGANEKSVKAKSGELAEGTAAFVSEEKEVLLEEAEKERPTPVPKKNRKGSKKLQAELEAAKELAEGNKEKYQRLLAEFDNARARSEKENGKMFDLGAKDTLEKLLPVVDNFERALDSIPDDEKNAFSEGVEMIYKQLMDTLASIGVEPMNAVGKQFDPEYHNAVIHVEDESFGENEVVEEMQKGYMYKDHVLRHSMVKVAN